MRDYENDKVYFAASPTEEIGDKLAGKVSDYYSYLTSSALVDLWRRAYYSYYGLLEDTAMSGFGIFAIGRIRQGGQEGEVSSIKVNHLRNLVTHQHVLTTQQQLALKCRAINSDSDALSQAYLGDGILDYYCREKGIDDLFNKMDEIGLIFGECFVKLDYDSTIGDTKQIGPNGQPIKDGELIAETIHPFNVIRDITESKPDVPWHIIHSTKNRFELAAKYQHAAEELLSASTDITSGKRYVDPTKIIPAAGVGTKQTDLIDVYEFFHKKTLTVPQGRKTIFLQDGTVLFDGPMPMEDYPIYRHAASDIEGSPFGYTIAFDLLGIQQMLDKLYSVVCSNQLASGMQNFWQPPGNQLTKTEIAGGLNLLESVFKPEVLEMLNTPKEIFAFIDKLEKIMEILSGISAVNRGETPEQLKSGTSLAFVASTAMTFNSGNQRSFKKAKEDIGSGIIKILRDFVTIEKQAVIAGQFNRPLMKTYIGSGLSKISKVYIEDISPVAKTQAGKIQIAQDLLQAGLIRNTREYLTVVNTGNLEPLYESEMSEILLVKAENEDLRDYKSPIMLAADDHRLHWLEHRALLANPDARKDPQLIQVVTAHMSEHLGQWLNLQSGNPATLAIMGEQPLPMPAAPMLNAPQGQGQPPQVGGGNPAAVMGGDSPVQQQAAQIKPPAQPNLPKNADPNSQDAYAKMQGANNQ
jgi:hypothetical protein